VGDVILVKPGNYAQFHVQDRDLTVVAEIPGTVTVAGPVRVTNVAEGKRVALIDLSATGVGTDALILADNAGSVRVRGGTWRAADETTGWFLVSSGVRAVNCADVALRSMTLQGGDGKDSSLSPFSGPGSGGHGLLAHESNVALFHCTLIGADGGSDVIEEGYDGGWGGSGLYMTGGFAHLVSSTFDGGNGGNGGEEDGIPPFINPAGNGGHGGHGIRAAGGAQYQASAALVQQLALEASGGVGGAGGPGFWKGNGAPGQPGLPLAALGQTTATDLPGPVLRLNAGGLWRPGTPETLTLIGNPGDYAVLTLSPKADFRPVASKQGVLLLGGKPSLKPLGTIPASGVLSVTLDGFALPAGWDGRTLELQAWAVAPDGPGVLSAAATIAIVDPAF
jgi:hypothetical protein